MRKNEAYPSKYFKAKDLPNDWTLTVEVEMARMEKFENGRGKEEAEKLVVYFRKQKSGLVTGGTNSLKSPARKIATTGKAI